MEFATTQWNVVLTAGEGQSPEADAALQALCSTYWMPLYAHVRRMGYEVEDAQDLTQEFFARFLAKENWTAADQKRGRFRTFLLTALTNFLINERERAGRVKRGGADRPLSIDVEDAEDWIMSLASPEAPPERLFDRCWAETLIESAMSGLRSEFSTDGNEVVFEKLKFCIWGEKRTASYRATASELGMTEGAVKVAVHRLRKRFRERLRAAVAETVEVPDEIDEELRHLIAILSAPD